MTVPPAGPPRAFTRARALALLGGVLVGFLALFAFPAGAAQAHAAVVRTNPEAGSVLTDAPPQVVITFSEAVTPVDARISVISPAGKRIDSGRPFQTGNDLHIPVRTDVPGGTYLVSYRVISADTHPVGGGFTYAVGAPSAGGAPKAINGGATDGAVAASVSIMQFVGFAGLILVLGAGMVLIALWPHRLDRRQPIRLAYLGLGLIALADLVGVVLQAPYDTGGSLGSISGSDISDVLDSRFGQTYMVRLAIVVVVAFLLRPVLAGRGGKADFALLTVLGAVGLGTWAFAGHAGATDVAPLTVVADVAHLASVGIWVGGLVMLGAFLLRRANARELGAILPVWSNWAMLAVTVLVLSGTAQALIEIGTVHALLHTTYGRLVIIKVLLLGAILLFAQRARVLVQKHAGAAVAEVEGELVPAYAAAAGGEGSAAADPGAPEHPDPRGGAPAAEGDADAATDETDEYDDYDRVRTVPRQPIEGGVLRRLRRSVLVELGIAVAVLVATAILVQSSPGRAADAQAALDASANNLITLNSRLYALQVDFAPNNGQTEIHLFATSPQGVPIKIAEWKVTATLPAKHLGPIPATITSLTDSHAIGEINLTVPGNWTFAFTLRVGAFDEATVTTVVPIN